MASLKVNGLIPGHYEGELIEVDVDRYGVVIDDYWRRKLLEGKSCCEIVVKPIIKSIKKKETAKPEEVDES